jgi:hypothetical protein
MKKIMKNGKQHEEKTRPAQKFGIHPCVDEKPALRSAHGRIRVGFGV